MRIAFISTMAGFAWGGSEELWVKTAELALKEGHQVMVVVYNWSELPPKIEALVARGAHLYRRERRTVLPLSIRLYKKFYENFITRNKLLKQLQRFFPNVICISNGATYSSIFDVELTTAITRLGSPYVNISQFNEEHYNLHPSSFWSARSHLSKSSKALFVSERNLNTARRQLATDLPNAVVVSNPLNISTYTVVTPPIGTVINFASVARLECRLKGQDILLEILTSETWQTREWHLNLYGKGPDEVYLQELVRYFKLEKRVSFMGHVSDIRSVWRSNHLLLMPSIGEGTPLSLMEAMVCGRPAVVSDVGGNSELIIESVNGFLADAPSIRSFGAALERAWNQQHNWNDMGRKAHAISMQKIDLYTEKTVLRYITDSVII
jgi:glycosyltransferase involved in cell wall biosynthesis